MNISQRFEIYIERNVFSESVEIYLMKKNAGGTYLAKIDWEKINPHAVMSGENKDKFAITVPNDSMENAGKGERNPFIRQLIGELNRCDFMEDSPTVTGLEGELKAKDEHLGDMRKLIFDENITISRNE